MALPSCLLLFVLNDIAEATIIHKSILLDLVTKNETLKKNILQYFGYLMELNFVILGFRVLGLGV